MAITGDGSATDPFVVTTYEELKEKMEASYTQGSTTYIQLGNNIDGEDYEIGSTFHIATQNRIQSIDFDLHGYAIKNWYIPGTQSPGANHTLFTILCDACIHDGKILNIYGQYTQDYKSHSVFYVNGVYSQSGIRRQVFENISFSFDVSKCKYIIQDASTNPYQATFTNCSFYWRSSTVFDGSNHVGIQTFGGTIFTSCDFYFDDLYLNAVSTSSSNFASLFPSGGTNFTPIPFTYCRFRGSLVSYTNSSGTAAMVVYIFPANILDNCVFSVTCTKEFPESYTGTLNPYLTRLNYSTTRLNLVDIDLADGVGISGSNTQFIKAHTNQMDMRENPNADVVLNDELHWDVQKG